MGVDDPLGDAEAEAAAFDVVFPGVMASIERFKQVVEDFRCNGIAAVLNGEGGEAS